MTKAQRILRLNNGKRSTREIADAVGCLPEYVRVVLRQRYRDGQSVMSEADRRYLASPHGKAAKKTKDDRYHERLYSDPSRHEARKARYRHYNRYQRKQPEQHVT